MKTRKNFKHIIVNGVEYLYTVSLRSGKIIIYKDKKYEIAISKIKFPKNFLHSSWRGKFEDAGFGKLEIEYIIKNLI